MTLSTRVLYVACGVTASSAAHTVASYAPLRTAPHAVIWLCLSLVAVEVTCFYKAVFNR